VGWILLCFVASCNLFVNLAASTTVSGETDGEATDTGTDTDADEEVRGKKGHGVKTETKIHFFGLSTRSELSTATVTSKVNSMVFVKDTKSGAFYSLVFARIFFTVILICFTGLPSLLAVTESSEMFQIVGTGNGNIVTGVTGAIAQVTTC
jgi:hypothetical protein